jgi:guanylate kinase
MIFVLLGPSGAGKTTLLKHSGLPELISHTTRNPRQNEVDGVDYYFVSREEFKTLDLLERTEYAGNFYGLARQEADRYLHAIIATDRNGAEQLRRICSVIVIYVQIRPFTMIKRMINRGESWGNVVKRAKNAVVADEFSNQGFADFVVNNDGDLQSAIEQLHAIIDSLIYNQWHGFSLERQIINKAGTTPAF